LYVAAAAALAEENALAATLQVAAAYDELMLAHKKEVHCNIITAEVGRHQTSFLKFQARH
jgi:hypothetical protein